MISAKDCKIVPRVAVQPDLFGWFPDDEPTPVRPGVEYEAVIGKGGAVSCRTDNGRFLGLKPGEFDFVCPLIPRSETVLENGGADGNVWRVFSLDDNKRARLVYVTPMREWMWSEM